MKYDRLTEGHIQQTRTLFPEPDDDYSYDEQTDVSQLVKELVYAYQASVKENEKLVSELKDIKIRKWWDEMDLVTDRNTGNTVVIRTHYQLEMKAMRLEIAPEIMHLTRLGP